MDFCVNLRERNRAHVYGVGGGCLRVGDGV